MERRKKGQQTGSSAAVVIAIILGLLILYILFLPPEARQELLEDETSAGGGTASLTANYTILSEEVGRLDYIATTSFKKTIPNVYLYETESAKELHVENPFYIKNGWFSYADKNMTFYIDDFANTDNVRISFAAKSHEGVLAISLNNNRIYEYGIGQYNVDPIALDKNLLQRTNILKLEVLGVGMRFWKTNMYEFENFKIVGNIRDISAQRSSSVFLLTGTEKHGLSKASLKFVPYCSRASSLGPLDVAVNGRNVFSGIPVCDDPYSISLSPDILEAGENSVIFSTSKGSYSIEQIRVEGTLEGTKEYTQYFRLNDTLYDSIVDGRRDIYVQMEFIDDSKSKEGVISINGHYLYLDQVEPKYEKSIRSMIRRGNNYIVIDPRTTLDIVSLEILAKK